MRHALTTAPRSSTPRREGTEEFNSQAVVFYKKEDGFDVQDDHPFYPPEELHSASRPHTHAHPSTHNGVPCFLKHAANSPQPPIQAFYCLSANSPSTFPYPAHLTAPHLQPAQPHSNALHTPWGPSPSCLGG